MWGGNKLLLALDQVLDDTSLVEGFLGELALDWEDVLQLQFFSFLLG